MSQDIKPSDLQIHEQLLIHRRRTGLSQLEYAEKLAVNYHAYVLIELGQAVSVPHLKMPRIAHLEAFEICYLLRRRKHKRQWEVASDLGISTHWLSKIERGFADCKELCDYWGLSVRASLDNKGAS